MPDVIVEAGLAERYVESLKRSAELYYDLRREFPEQAQYAVALAFRIRYVMQMNAREAMHLIELRSSPQGHPATGASPRRWHDSCVRSPATRQLPMP